MGCSPENDCSSTSCERFEPGTGEGVALVEFREYPENIIRAGAYNVPGRDGKAIMYDSLGLSSSSVANCGKYTKSACGETLYFDYYPNELSFDYGFADTWFSYIYDTTNDAGVVGTPCYHIETETVTNTQTGASSSTDTCYPCGSFTCSPATTTISYTVDDGTQECGCSDPDCPHPTLFAIGTLSKKIAFSYDSLSTTLPNGVSDFEVSDDGTTWTDVWNGNESIPTEYISGDNPYQAGDESFNDFHIFELDSGASTGFRIKAQIKAVYDDSGATTTFSGTSWTITEILAPGTGYSTNQTFTLEYTHTLPDNSTTVLNLNLRVKAVEPYQATQGQPGFDVLRAGDTINGHTITRVFHTDLDNFPYHIAYIDGNGSSFTKETQYTSSRSHQITVKAGWMVQNRAILVGFYEFLDKSVQYETIDFDSNAPDTFNILTQPAVIATVTNGIVTNLTLIDGGGGWDQYGRQPEVIITPPYLNTGAQATCKAEFVNGVMTAIKVDLGGTGYSSANPPKVYVRNVFKQETTVIPFDAYDAGDLAYTQGLIDSLPGGVTSEMLDKVVLCYENEESEQVSYDTVPNIDVKQDPDINRVQNIPQALYHFPVVDPMNPIVMVKYNLDYLKNSDLDAFWKNLVLEEKERNQALRTQDLQDISQDDVREYAINRERLVESAQGRFSSLPHASTYTKYPMRQYRADRRKKVNITVTLKCVPEDFGCGHIGCSPPNTGNVDNTSGNTVTTYSMSPLLGSGCKTWNATGVLPMWNSLTKSANVWSDAIEAHGNPYNVGEYLP